ncbi:MAG: S41 family peptidase [Bacteroidales bacterium]
MRKILLSASILASVFSAQADENTPLWLRYNSVSPDGSKIAFAYKGNIFTVPANGGQAIQLTTNPAHDTRPIWSPDGQNIVFASNRDGNFDLFIVDAKGGKAKKLTSHSANEFPEAFLNSGKILYSSNIQQSINSSQFPSGYTQTYVIDKNGGRPELFTSHTMEDIAVNPRNQEILFTDRKGYEDTWRKHHQSSIARDVWSYSPENQSFKKLTNFKGEDRNGVWINDHSFYFLSEKDGSFNIYKKDLTDNSEKQITTFKKHPVRFLSASNNGLLSFAYDGSIYTMKEGEEPKKVAVSIADDYDNDAQVVYKNITSGTTDISVSPNGKEIAFIANGELFVTSADYETTRRLTNTATQERNVEFAPDGRSIFFSAERNGIWNIWRVKLDNKDDKSFLYANEITEEPVTEASIASFQPKVSPDGKEVAYLEDRTAIRVINLESSKTRTVLDKKFNYSYTDGDQEFEWSPDGKWIVARYISVGGWNNPDIAMIKADGSGEVHNLTESGYADGAPEFVLDGKAILWTSDKNGYRSHGSWGASSDIYLMFLDEEAYDNFNMNKEETALYQGDQSADSVKVAENKDPKKKEKKEKKAEKKDIVYDFKNVRNRIVRLTPNTLMSLSSYTLSPKGDKLYFISEGDLWERDLKDGNMKQLAKGVGRGEIIPDKDFNNLYVNGYNSIKKIALPAGTVTPVSYKAEFINKPYEERQYIFDHAWQQVQDKFYDPTIHGIDWKGYKDEYQRYLPYINNNFDFAEMLSELLGELNASHTGARFRASSNVPGTASLGIFADSSYKGDGIRIEEIMAQGPLDKARLGISKGMIIEEIDGVSVKQGEDYYPLLQGKAGKQTILTIYDPVKKKHLVEKVKPISYGEQNSLLYKRWVDSRRELVDKLSGGRLGYVHIQGMDSKSFRTVYSELLGLNRQKEAVIVDTRHNGGGWLHDDLVTLLGGKVYEKFAPRGQFIGNDPFNKWTKPSVVLMCEDNYSKAHGVPYVYKQLGIGKLIGAPVPGTMTAVWWENQIDPSIVFGIPQVGVQDMNGEYLENQELQPDIEVYNTPESVVRGEDKQIEAAVNELLRQLDQK